MKAYIYGKTEEAQRVPQLGWNNIGERGFYAFTNGIVYEYRAQNEAYMCRSAENVVRCLCFSVLGTAGQNGGTKRSVYIGLISVYFWGRRLGRRFA